MNRYLIIWSFILLSVPMLAFGQYGSDSLVFYPQRYRQITLGLQDGGLLRTLPGDAYGYAGLQYNHGSGNLRRAQEAYKSSTVAFYTQGFNTIGRFKIGAAFLFDKVWEDSLANSLKGPYEDIRPFYYFAGKNGKYERQNYKINALLNYELLKEKLYLSVGADYQTHWTTRSVDPRPDVKYFRLLIDPGVNYRTKNQLVSASLIWGYGNEENSISYKNRNYEFSTTFPDRISYVNQGYGYIVLKDTSTLRRYDDYIGWKIAYHAQLNNWNVQALLKQTTAKEDNTHDTKYRTNYHLRSTFEWSDYDLQLLFSERHAHRHQQVSISARLQQGDDWNRAFNAHNYSTTNTYVDFSYHYQFNNHRPWQPEMGLRVIYQQSSKEDAAAAHYLEQQYIQPGVRLASYYHSQRNGDRLSVMFEPSFRIPINVELAVPATQENVFSQGVVYPDFYYFSSKSWHLDASCHYFSSRLLNRYPLGFSVNAIYAKQIDTSTEVFNAAFIPDGQRFLLNVGIHLFL